MKCAWMLTSVFVIGCALGCGGGGGGGSTGSSVDGTYSAQYQQSNSLAGTGDFTIQSGGRATGHLREGGTNRTGLVVGRIVRGQITGTSVMSGDSQIGFSGTVQQQGGRLVMHITFAGSSVTATYTLTRV